MRIRSFVALGVLTACLLGACSDPHQPEPLTVTWTERPLPVPAGAPGRSVVRDAVQCGEGWWVVGAVLLDRPSETRDTRPAAWFSPQGRTWTPVAVEAHTFWGRRAIINSVACSRGRIAALGARSGGAHGNPRVTSFRMDGEALVDVPAVFTQYGGISATNVGPIAAGPTGWLITGNRLTGPAVWSTDDPRGFTLVEGEPGLTDDGDLEALAQGAGWSGQEWVLVGSGSRPGSRLDPEPLAWTSPDGLVWAPEKMPDDDGVQDVQRVAMLTDGRLLAVGRSGDGFAGWVRDEDGWAEAVPFGAIAQEWSGAPYVASLAPTSAGVLATVSTGERYELWQTGDGRSWQRVDTPLSPRTAGDHTLMVAAGEDLLVVADAGDGGHVWMGRLSP